MAVSGEEFVEISGQGHGKLNLFEVAEARTPRFAVMAGHDQDRELLLAVARLEPLGRNSFGKEKRRKIVTAVADGPEAKEPDAQCRRDQNEPNRPSSEPTRMSGHCLTL